MLENMKEISVLLGPTPQQYEIICKELNEDSDRFKININLLSEWLRFQPHLPQNYDHELLPIFLRGCKNDLERAKKKLDNFFTARTTVTEFFADRDPLSNEIQLASQSFQIATIPKLSPSGHRVSFHKFTDVDASLFVTKDVFRYILMTADLRMLEEKAIAGDIFVFDVKHMGAGHCTRLAQPVLLSKMLSLVQQAYPQRLAQIHLINTPNNIHTLVTLFKSCMKEKMRNRFNLHKEGFDLEEILPKDCIPKDYGGNLPSMQTLHDIGHKKITDNRDWFLKQNNIKADNKKRIEQNNNHSLFNSDSIYGTEGAFRKLNID
ncbi:retinol-binding protein pinta-like [Chrysoperla carnea]|uniref:retinol-binding protein pinta-like n=1 Tax=Chrysoperla carnea TaxID=189513 RepID=UPI001D0792B9|nr:retinol-binding protein pinta-like [Chrysoperla carnea]